MMCAVNIRSSFGLFVALFVGPWLIFCCRRYFCVVSVVSVCSLSFLAVRCIFFVKVVHFASSLLLCLVRRLFMAHMPVDSSFPSSTLH